MPLCWDLVPSARCLWPVCATWVQRKIIGIDPVPERTALALKMGATDAVNSTGGEAEDDVRRILNGELADVAVEAVGHKAQAFNDAVLLTRHHGDILYFGVPPAPMNDVHFKDAMLKNITIRTSLHPDFERTFPLAMQWLAERPSRSFAVADASISSGSDAGCIRYFSRTGRGGAIKVLVEFPALAGTR